MTLLPENHTEPGLAGGIDDLVCGLEMGPDGNLNGVNYGNELVRLDPQTGETLDRVSLQGVEIRSCAMAFDCHDERLLVANGADRTIYEITESGLAAGTASVVVDLSEQLQQPWDPTGLEYDPVTGHAWLSAGWELHYVELEDGGRAHTVGRFVEPEHSLRTGTQVSNLQYLPVCE